MGLAGRTAGHFTADSHVVPAPDAGVGTIDQPDEGQTIGGSTAVRIWLHAYGNVPLTAIPCHYSFNGGSVVTQTYNGPEIDPGDSVLFMFAQPLVPLSAGLLPPNLLK